VVAHIRDADEGLDRVRADLDAFGEVGDGVVLVNGEVEDGALGLVVAREQAFAFDKDHLAGAGCGASTGDRRDEI
jgi:hypothetical protein